MDTVPDHDVWEPWTPHDIAERMADARFPWCVVGGWAIDLFLGRRTRAHHDLEIAVPRRHFPAVRRRLHPLKAFVAFVGEVHPLAEDAITPPHRYQNWFFDAEAGVWRIDVMLEPGDARTWVYRRHRHITAPRSEMVGWRDGIPFLAPQGVLLFKSNNQREKDEADFDACVGEMSPNARAWLRNALKDVTMDEHWIARL